jgi:hypothetical protein
MNACRAHTEALPHPLCEPLRARRPWPRALAAAALCVAGLCGLAAAQAAAANGGPSQRRDDRIALAVIGDSDSQGFQDLIDRRDRPIPRGGPYHGSTFQWTEVLASLRGDRLDLGEWDVHGMPAWTARVLEWTGLDGAVSSWGWEVRAPRKRDHRYNFAASGEGCTALFGGRSRQVPRLLRLMDEDPARWRTGIVVIKIGGNDFGNGAAQLDLLAKDPAAPSVRAKMDYCIDEIRQAVGTIRQAHPGTRIVLGGVFDNADWERYFDRWQSPLLLTNISKGLDHFDHALQAIAAADPRIAFFSDRRWFDALWGSRDNDGRPRYRVFRLGPDVAVSNSRGDAPWNTTLDDGHAGLVWNAKWAQSLVDLIDARFDALVPAITDEELLRFVRATGVSQSTAKQ